MANRRISMNKIREIIRLNQDSRLSNRQIAKSLNISRPIVAQYLTDFKACKLKYGDIKGLDDDQLLKIFAQRKKSKSKRYEILSEKFDYLIKELKKPGVTLELLWQEYKKEQPQGYSYTQFCYHFQVWKSTLPLTMHLNHKAGDKMFVDFTGQKLQICDKITGEIVDVEVFVAILAASQLTYVEATGSQKKEDFIRANENALHYFGGVPKAIVPDCLKSGVTLANKYEPDINPAYADFARFYDTAIVPARPSSPQDKALAENAVKIVYRRIFAPLRDQVFYSTEELNAAIREKLDEHNHLPFQRLDMSRCELFLEVEKDLLKPLPIQKYEYKEFLSLKVQFNYHIELRGDHHYYSVPYRYRGKRVTVIYATDTVEIYYQNSRIAFHKRDRTKNGYTTKDEHMPAHHRFYADWSPQKFSSWGKAIGEETKTMVEKVLQSKKHPEQAFKVCLGILNLSKKYGNVRLNKACAKALDFNAYSYKTVKNILEKSLDGSEKEDFAQQILPVHKNIRGESYYN